MRRWRGVLVTTLLGAVVIALVISGVWTRQSTLASLRVTADQEAVPQVQVVYPQPGPPTHALDLPGDIDAWYQAPIYAQVSGYVKTWYKDFGAQVKTGDLLATISAPGLDEEYESAKAQLAVAEAQYRLGALTARRFRALSGTEAVSQQQVDVETADAAAQQAHVQAAEHEVARYAALEGFKRVVAPFDGVVTSRRTDIGDYVSAAGGDVGPQGASSELFSVADVHEMRVFVAVPQDYAGDLRPGLKATLSLPQFPNKTFVAQFLTTAKAFDPISRTVTTELTVPNPDYTIWPGTYADVHLVVPSDPDLLAVPEQALLFRAQGMQVAVVLPNNTVHLQDVTLGLNLGSVVQIESGLQPSDRVIDNPSDGLLEGESVQIVQGETAMALPAGETHAPASPNRQTVAARN
jgi:membrane fusion protein (multidrug efflux system)